MLIVSLIATYHRPTLLSNALACFESQSHEDRRCLVLDDGGQIEPQTGDRWRIVSHNRRCPTLTEKYCQLLAIAVHSWPNLDAVAIQDDDDLYGPDWLSSHAAVLESHQWSHPRQVWSLHHPPAVNGVPGLEPAAGRFWASAAVRIDLLRKVGGFFDTARPTFDQENLALWRREGGEPGRPDDCAAPQYCYGWGRSNHCSGRMGQGDWYDAHGKMTVGAVGTVFPAMDSQTERFYDLLATSAR